MNADGTIGNPLRRLVLRRALILSVCLAFRCVGAPGQIGAAESVVAAEQAYAPTMTFDVASVREAPHMDSFMVTGWLEPHTSSLRLENNTLENLLIQAYGIQMYQMANLPHWPWPAMFTIVAKSDRAADEKLAKLNDHDAMLEKEHMLQALLAERFKLKVHWETRQGETYNLVVAKPGRLQASRGAPPSAEEKKTWGDNPIPTLYQKNDGKGYDFIAHGASMADITDMLVGQLGHAVTDKTGLTGKYDFLLKYYGRTKQDRQADDMDPTLPIDEAIEAELGLKLVPTRGAIQVLVVDHVEKPSEN